jgi:hypothetical protein
MKLLLPWLVTALALVAAALFFIANRSKTEQLAKVRPQVQELENLRKENTELKASQLSGEEMERIRKNTEELIRLRNEVRQLRDTEKQLTQQVQSEKAATQRAQEQASAARSQAQTAQAQAQAALTQATVLTTNVPGLTQQQQLFAARYGLDPAAVAQGAVSSCFSNLRQLDGAKQQWALENRKTAEAIPSAQDVMPYLKEFPKCPAGGNYILNAVQSHPACSVPGHALPKTFE